MTSPPFHDEWGVSRAGAKNRQWHHLQRVAKYESRGFTCVPASTRLLIPLDRSSSLLKSEAFLMQVRGGGTGAVADAAGEPFHTCGRRAGGGVSHT